MMLDPIKGFLRKHWFLLGIIVCISGAHLFPRLGATGGLLHPEITVKYIGVSLIFFISGLSLHTEELQRAMRQWTIHFLIQSFTFVFIPLLFSVIVQILHKTTIDPWLIHGFLTVGCMPPPVSSGVILTKAVGGNEAAAIFNSAFGSFLGILITPWWLLHFLGSSSSASFSTIFGQLAATVVIPIILGQMMRSIFKHMLYKWNIPYGTISSVVLLLIIYTTFCDTFIGDDILVGEIDLLFVIFLVIATQCTLLMIAFWLATRPKLCLSPQDVVAVLFCSTHKSLTLGIPMLTLIFADDPQLSTLTLPLLVYHPVQILLGGVLVPTVRSWVQENTVLSHRHSGFMKIV